MTRDEKKKKLGNAIKRLRGLKNLKADKWVQAPDPGAAEAVVRWLQELGHTQRLVLKAELDLILNFRSVKEYEEWIREL
jgi:hypothetical protein